MVPAHRVSRRLPETMGMGTPGARIRCICDDGVKLAMVVTVLSQGEWGWRWDGT